MGTKGRKVPFGIEPWVVIQKLEDAGGKYLWNRAEPKKIYNMHKDYFSCDFKKGFEAMFKTADGGKGRTFIALEDGETAELIVTSAHQTCGRARGEVWVYKNLKFDEGSDKIPCTACALGTLAKAARDASGGARKAHAQAEFEKALAEASRASCFECLGKGILNELQQQQVRHTDRIYRESKENRPNFQKIYELAKKELAAVENRTSQAPRQQTARTAATSRYSSQGKDAEWRKNNRHARGEFKEGNHVKAWNYDEGKFKNGIISEWDSDDQNWTVTLDNGELLLVKASHANRKKGDGDGPDMEKISRRRRRLADRLNEGHAL